MTTGYTAIDQFLPEVLMYCNNCPSMMARIAITNAVIDFCEKTFILKSDATCFELDADEHTYTLKFNNDRYVALAVDEVFIDDSTKQPLIRTSEGELDTEYVGWRNHEGTTPGQYYLTEDINKIRFYPTPTSDSDHDVITRCIVRPKRDQVEFDEFLYEKWHEIIQSAARASLLLIPSASWFNPELARIFGLDYKRGYKNARSMVISGTGKHPGQVNPVSFGGMGSSRANRSYRPWG